jgi:hypothetical protein
MTDHHQDHTQPKPHGKLKQRIWYGVLVVAGGFGTAILAAIVGVITTAYVEISFKEPGSLTLDAFKDPRQWMDFHIDLVKPELFHAYYGDNDGTGHTTLRDAKFILRKFVLTQKILGEKIRSDGYSFSVVGFWKNDRIVLAHRGNKSGAQASYMLRIFQVPEISGDIFAGYELAEDFKLDGGGPDWIIKCPFLMLEEDIAARRYSDHTVLLRDFPFLATKCTEFSMPNSLTAVIAVTPSIDEVAGK